MRCALFLNLLTLVGCERVELPRMHAPTSFTGIAFDSCQGCSCCIDGKVPRLEPASFQSCGQCSVDTALSAHGISYAGLSHLELREPRKVAVGSRSRVELALETSSAVRLTLPREVSAFGVRLSDEVAGCMLRLSSPTRSVKVDFLQDTRHVLASVDGSALGSVELSARCFHATEVWIEELWIAPERAPAWPAEAVKPAGFEVSALPPPLVIGTDLLKWEPPVQVFGPYPGREDVALAVMRAPAVVEALGLRPGTDGFGLAQSGRGRLIVLGQRYHAGDESLTVEEGFVRVFFDESFRLQKVEAKNFVRGITLPKRKPIPPAAALRSAVRHGVGRAARPELGFFKGKLVYGFGDVCQRDYVDAFSAAHFQGPLICRRGIDGGSQVPSRWFAP